MHHFAFASEQKDIPRPADPERAERGLERLHGAAETTLDDGIRKEIDAALSDPAATALLKAIFGNSPYLARSAVNELEILAEILKTGPDAAWDRILVDLAALEAIGKKKPEDAPDHEELAGRLRTAKRRAALAIAIADITNTWDLERITGALTQLAEKTLHLAAAHLLRDRADKGAFELADGADPEKGSGLVILGMGKLGAGELNYSSDIDLIVLYDADAIKTDVPDRLQKNMVRLVRGLVGLMEERTADGYVFRTDLRLRPDPSAMPPAISVRAAETYYEGLGQNWERAAMIKARPVAGDIEAGARFLEHLKPFIWRKHLDFAAIEDIHSIKRQINAHRGGGAIALHGHNIKLGRGGIREIEFFAQTQQLIWGGREPELRKAGTKAALETLADFGRIERETADGMIEAYGFLRRVEHRLQMIGDEQTHTLPEDDAGIEALAVFLGYDNKETFTNDLLSRLRLVERHYANLFEDSPGLSSKGEARGNLVFTGGEPDPETLRTIEDMGFSAPETVDAAIRGWHRGRYRAMRSIRAREVLTELTPGLLEKLGGAPDPAGAFIKFDEFLSRLPSGVQLFSMFQSNPQLLDLLVEVLGSAPRLGQHLSHRPQILESVLAHGFFDPATDRETLGRDLAREYELAQRQAEDLEDALDATRRWAADKKFQFGVQILLGLVAPAEASWGLSAVAETVINGLLTRVEAEFAARHGTVPGGELAVVALGKLGSREMTPESDLDLIFVYQAADDALSDGAKPLQASQYYARLSQRLINALTVQTAEGGLYEVDMRLRPSGKAGPIASSLGAFIRYHEESAWTWEHLALTRARVIGGEKKLTAKVEAVINEALTRERDADKLLSDVAEMRMRMDAEHHTDVVWAVKHLRGGLVDVEIITQYLQLRHASEHPEILSANTWMALNRIRDAGLLGSEESTQLIEALDLWQGIQGILRVTLEGTPKEESALAAPALRQVLVRACSEVDFDALKAKIETAARTVRGIYARLIGPVGKNNPEK